MPSWTSIAPAVRAMTLTSVPGVAVGHWSDEAGRTGCTVIVLPSPNVTAVEVRGGAPGSREIALLAPGMRVEEAQAILFTGGSAYGLAAADGVMSELESSGRGHATPWGVVPIVPAAVIFDLSEGDPLARPDRASGAAAFQAASRDPVQQGRVGAGTGATVAKLGGPGTGQPGGIGSVALRAGDATVGALAVVNAVGHVFDLDGHQVTKGEASQIGFGVDLTNTTLVCVATDARIGRADLLRLAVRSQDAVAAVIRPAHTRYDGDAAFVVSCGSVDADLDLLGEVAFAATAQAIVRAVAP